MARNYFCAYHSYLKSMRNLSDAECGRLFRALLMYSAGEVPTNLQDRESVAFDFITEQIDRDSERYDAKCQGNRRNVGKRWKGQDTAECEPVRADSDDTNVSDAPEEVRSNDNDTTDTAECEPVRADSDDTNVYERKPSYTTAYEQYQRKGKGERKGGSSPSPSFRPYPDDQPLMSAEEARRRQDELDAVFDAATKAGMPDTQAVHERLDALTAQYSAEWVLQAIDETANHASNPNIAYIRKVLENMESGGGKGRDAPEKGGEPVSDWDKYGSSFFAV